jgi:hypothetical protein
VLKYDLFSSLALQDPITSVVIATIGIFWGRLCTGHTYPFPGEFHLLALWSFLPREATTGRVWLSVEFFSEAMGTDQ